MNEVKLYVDLKIPDTAAITTFHLLEKMGYQVEKLKRTIYYKFDIDGNKEDFSKKIGKVDILVNANKNKFSTSLSKEEGFTYILVKERGDKCEGLLSALTKRLGFKEIQSIEKGVLWALKTDSVKKEKIAQEIANKLLHNEHYQEVDVL